MDAIEKLSRDDRITVRRAGAPDPEGECVVYWMQRAQRATDNPALDVAIRVGNELKKPVVLREKVTSSAEARNAHPKPNKSKRANFEVIL